MAHIEDKINAHLLCIYSDASSWTKRDAGGEVCGTRWEIGSCRINTYSIGKFKGSY